MAGTVRTFAHIRTAPSMLISKANPLTRKITSQQTELTMENFVTQFKIEIHPPTPLITVLESSLSDGLGGSSEKQITSPLG